jgi:hypothetical protein
MAGTATRNAWGGEIRAGEPALHVAAADGSDVFFGPAEVRDAAGGRALGVAIALCAPEAPDRPQAFALASGGPVRYGDGTRVRSLSIEHAIEARRAVDQIAVSFAAATRDAAVAGDAAFRAACAALGEIDRCLRAAEAILARSPEARLAAEVHDRIGAMRRPARAELARSLADVERALRTVEQDGALSDGERSLVRAALLQMRAELRVWLDRPSGGGE